MALFGTEMVDVTTPDGRRLTLPAQLAAGFPALKPFAPPPTVAAPPELPSAPPAPDFTEQDRVDLTPPDAAAPTGSTEPVVPPAPPQAPQQPAPPARLPTATEAYVGEQEAFDRKKEVIEQSAQAEADAATQEALELEERNRRTDEILAQRQQQSIANQKDLDARMLDYDRRATEIANTKVDRSVEHPILAAIGVALGAIGSSMKGESGNPALDMLLKQIDRKVNAQLQDLELKRSGLAMARDRMGLAREAGREKLSEFDVQRDAEIQRAQRKIEEIKTRSASSAVKARGDQLQADLEVERQRGRGVYAEREQARIEREQERKAQAQRHRESIGLQREQMQQSERQFQQTFSENVRQFDIREDNDIRAAELAAKGKGKEVVAKAQKELTELGIRNPSTGEFLLEPKGQEMVKQAETMEKSASKIRAAAAKEKDPDRRQALESRANAEAQKASEIRGQAKLEYAVKGHNGDHASKLYSKVAAAQTGLTLIDEIKALRKANGPKWTVTTAADQAIRSKLGILALQVKEAYQLGALDRGSSEYLDRITGGDATKITTGDITGMLDAAIGTTASLDALADALELKGRNDLGEVMEGAHNFKFKRDKHRVASKEDELAIKVFDAKTPLEAARGETRRPEPDPLRGDVVHPNQRPSPAEVARIRSVEESGSKRYAGLSGKQADAVELQLKAYKQNSKSDDDAAQDKAQKVGSLLVGLATDKRPELREAMLGVLKEEAPELYAQAISKLPESERKAATGTAAVKAEITPTALLRGAAMRGDVAASQELLRRATGGDKEAAKSLLDIASTRRGTR